MAKSFKPIICLDFDGVIHSYTSGWKGACTIPDPIVPGAIEAILTYMDAGFIVAVFSSRGRHLFGRWAMKRWLKQEFVKQWFSGERSKIYDVECEYWGDAASLVNRIKFPLLKPAATITIDDRAITFNGSWEDLMPDDIRNFKPWNKR